jgi:1-phosphofructokinase family hexose kinase
MNVLCVTLHPAIDKAIRVKRLVPDEIARATVAMIYGGGKGNNVARALTHLKVPAIATGYQGGYSGKFITEELRKEGIRTEFVECKADTRTSILIQEDDTGYTYAVYEPGQKVEDAEIDALMDKFTSLLPETSLVLLCGSGQTDALARVYGRMITIAKHQGVHSLIDSSGPALDYGIDALPYMVKVNQHELGFYLGRTLDTLEKQVDAIIEMQKKGIAYVALSRGPEGMIGTDGKDVWSGNVKVERVINTVGCGDSLLAGVAKALLENAALADLIRWGIACGTANTQVRGAGFLELGTVHNLVEKAKIIQVTR